MKKGSLLVTLQYTIELLLFYIDRYRCLFYYMFTLSVHHLKRFHSLQSPHPNPSSSVKPSISGILWNSPLSRIRIGTSAIRFPSTTGWKPWHAVLPVCYMAE